VVEYEGLLHPVECKYKERPNSQDGRGIRAFRNLYPSHRLGEASVACLSKSPWEIKDGNMARYGGQSWF